MRSVLAVFCAVAALALAPAAGAAPLRFFQSPSHNIGCAIQRGFARCDIREKTWRAPERPGSCELDFGSALGVGRRGRGRFLCAGDTVAGQGPVLRYGRSVRLGAMRCTSRRAGMRCRSRRGHGFTLSRGAYRLF